MRPSSEQYAVAEDGTRIYFERFSPNGSARRDAPPVLMVMGLGANGRLWAPGIRRLLAAGYEGIALDNRGCGRSDSPWRPFTTRTMAGDAVAVLDELGVERAHVAGGSMGGMVAQELALEFPDRVSSLLLAATTGGLPRLDLVPRRGLQQVVEMALRPLRPATDPEQRVRDFLNAIVSEDFAKECRPGDEAWETVAVSLEDPNRQRGLALQVLAFLRHSSWSRLPQLKIPVQIHHGTADPLIPFAAGRELARRIPDAELVVYPGAGHAMLLERADEGAERIVAFLAECEAPARRRNAEGV